MRMSESIKALAEALAAAQGEMPAAELNAVNPFLKNKFADLGSIISTAKPVMAKHGLSVSQLPVTIDGCVGVTTILMHSSGEWLESTVTLPVGDEKGKSMAQVAGSIVTYLRRYSLSAALGMYADEDADGGEVSAKSKGDRATLKKANDWPVRPWDAETLKRAMAKKVADYRGKSKEPNEGQLDYCRSSLGKLGLSDPERHTVTLYLFGVESTGDLSAAQCSALIDWVGAKPPDYEFSQDAKVEARAVIKQYQLERGQQEMALPA